MFSLICVWIHGWVNNGEAGDLRRYCSHYDITVMSIDRLSTHQSISSCLSANNQSKVTLWFISACKVTSIDIVWKISFWYQWNRNNNKLIAVQNHTSSFVWNHFWLAGLFIFKLGVDSFQCWLQWSPYDMVITGVNTEMKMSPFWWNFHN